MTTKIEWCDEVWNPIVGCSKISEGCRNCYAEKFAKRLAGAGVSGYSTVRGWNGAVVLRESELEKPLRWRKPRRIFVGSMTDLFHESAPAEAIARVFGIMSRAIHHTYLLLTKRPGIMHEFFVRWMRSWPAHPAFSTTWLGVSVENQKTADERIPELLRIPAAVHFVSYEPALGELNAFWAYVRRSIRPGETRGIDWVIAGSETGPGRRPADLDWFRLVRDQCSETGVPFFFKKDSHGNHELDGVAHEAFPTMIG